MIDVHEREAEPIPRVTREAGAPFSRPLSLIEEDVWRATRVMTVEKRTNFGFIRVGMRLTGPLDAGALEAATVLVDARHDVWRTSYEERDGVPVALVEPEARSTFRVVDVSGDADSEARAKDEIASDCAAGFVLDRAPLHRWLLVRLGPESHIFYHFAHHTVCDGFTHVLLFRELGALYDALSAGLSPSLPAPALQYSDVAEWERRWLDEDAGAAFAAFWKQHVLVPPLPKPLAAMPERPDGQRLFRAGRHLADMRSGPALAAFCKATGRSQHAVLLAGLVAMLGREGANGSPVAVLSVSRKRETMRTLGNFTKFFPYRHAVDPARPFTALLDEVQSTLAACQRYQRQPPRFTPKEGIPYRVFFNYYTLGPTLQLRGVDVQVVGIFEKSHVLFDLEVNLVLGLDGVLRLMLDYNAELIEHDVLIGFVDRYDALLLAAAARPDAAVVQL